MAGEGFMQRQPFWRALGAVTLCAASFCAQAAGFTLSSPSLKAGGTLSLNEVFNGFGCTGNNISPALQWANAPAGTKSFAVTLYDPDAPTGSGWWHWVVFNIPAKAQGLPAGAGNAAGDGLPSPAQQGRTDFGSLGFGGACPPPGDKPHRYVFTLYALKVEKLDIPTEATAAFIGYNLIANSLGKTIFTVKYGR